MKSVALISITAFLLWTFPAVGHDIYTGVHGKGGQLCCGGSDCAATIYREKAGVYEFLTREKEWVSIPQDRITFLPIPGDEPTGDSHYSHLCYRPATDADRSGPYADRIIGDIYLYCAFIPPGAI